MAAELKKEIELEIAHVLFLDIVDYSKLPIHQQRAFVERLNEIVRGTDEFQGAEKAGRSNRGNFFAALKRRIDRLAIPHNRTHAFSHCRLSLPSPRGGHGNE